MIHHAFLLSFLLILSSGSAFVARSTLRDSTNKFGFARLSFDRSIGMKMSTETAADKETLEQVLDVAIDASKKAGEIIIGNAGGAEVTKCKANR